MTRSKKALANIVATFVFQFTLFVFSLITKKIFILYLPIELMGISDLIATFFNSLLIVNIGFSSIYVFNLYKLLASENYAEINEYVSIYRKIFNYIAWFVLIISVLFIPFLLNAFNFGVSDSVIIYGVYFTEIIVVFLNYKLMFKSSIIKATQNEYYSMIASVFISIVSFTLKIISIVVFKNFLLYIIANAAQTIFINLYNYLYVDKKLGLINYRKNVSWKEVKKSNALEQSKKYIYRSLYSMIYHTMDNYIISFFFSSNPIGYLSSYTMILNTAKTFLQTIFMSLAGGMANYKYKEKDVDGYYKITMALSFLCFMLSALVSVGFFTLINDFILLWLGESYLMGKDIVWALSMILLSDTLFVSISNVFNIEGYMFIEKRPLIVSIILNLIISILLAQAIGIGGVFIGTIVGNVVFYASKVHYVSNNIFRHKRREIILSLVMFTLLIMIEVTLVGTISDMLVPQVINIVHFLIKMTVVIVLVLSLNVLLFYKTDPFKILMKSFFSIIKNNQ